MNTRNLLTALAVSVSLFGATSASAVADDAPSDSGACQADVTSQPFASWGDTSAYELAPNGDFEQGLDGWDVSGGAGLAWGAEPWSVTDASESQSLDLPEGSSATSPSICIDANDPTIRFFDVNNGDPASLLSVSVSFTTVLGVQVSIPIGTITSGSDWAPSPQIFVDVNLLALDTTIPVQFTFTPIGAGDWEIDDLYLDPWGRT